MSSHKKLLSFVGPAHHIQLMRPIERKLVERGWEVVRYTADTEAMFQVGLLDYYPGEAFRWLSDYIDEEEAAHLFKGHAEWFRSLYSTPNEASLFAPQMADKIIRAICGEFTSTRALVKKEKPEACLALHEINRWGRLLGHASTRRRIPFWTLQEGLYYGAPFLYTGHTRYSHSFVWGEATRSLLQRAGCPPERIIVSGHPDLRGRIALATRQRDEYRAGLPADLHGRRLAFVFLGNVDVQETAANLFAGWDAQREWGLIVRYHQLSSLPAIQKIRKLFAGHPGCHVSEGEGAEPGDQWRAMGVAELAFVVGCSSVVLEWTAMQKPLGIYPAPAGPRDYSKDPPIGIDCTPLSWLDAIQAVSTRWEGECREKAKEWLEGELIEGDGAERIATIIDGGQ